MTCSNCAHFLDGAPINAAAAPKVDFSVGVCRRYPPRAFDAVQDDMGRVDAISAFPAVHREQMCGEFVEHTSFARRVLRKAEAA